MRAFEGLGQVVKYRVVVVGVSRVALLLNNSKVHRIDNAAAGLNTVVILPSLLIIGFQSEFFRSALFCNYGIAPVDKKVSLSLTALLLVYKHTYGRCQGQWDSQSRHFSLKRVQVCRKTQVLAMQLYAWCFLQKRDLYKGYEYKEHLYRVYLTCRRREREV